MADQTFTLSSPDFDDGGVILARFTCDGEDVSPPLEWQDAPEQTQAMALLVDDPDADGFVHWVAYNLTGSRTGGVPEGASESPDGPAQGTNDFGKTGWGGPCPPSGTHTYRFSLMALDAPLELAGTPSADDLRTAAAGHVLDEAVLTARYRRKGLNGG